MNGDQNEIKNPFYKVLGEITAIWALLNIGYYLIIPRFGYELSYNSSPISISLYFLLWVVIILNIFWQLYKRWFSNDEEIWWYGLLCLVSAGLLLCLVYVYSLLPSLNGPLISSYTDILFATAWYFLPKSIEILVQQLLITVLVLELFYRFNSLKNILIGYALCFGGSHIVLYMMSGDPVPYSFVMTLGAFLSSLVFPYLILKVKGGFVYAYMIHFIFYLILASLLHFLPAPGYVL